MQLLNIWALNIWAVLLYFVAVSFFLIACKGKSSKAWRLGVENLINRLLTFWAMGSVEYLCSNAYKVSI